MPLGPGTCPCRRRATGMPGAARRALGATRVGGHRRLWTSPGGYGHADHADPRGTTSGPLVHGACHLRRKQRRGGQSFLAGECFSYRCEWLHVAVNPRGIHNRWCQALTSQSYIGILQTKISHGEGYEARRRGPYTMPVGQHMEGRRGEHHAGVNIRSAPVYHLLAVDDQREPREHGLDQHAILPLPYSPAWSPS